MKVQMTDYILIPSPPASHDHKLQIYRKEKTRFLLLKKRQISAVDLVETELEATLQSSYRLIDNEACACTVLKAIHPRQASKKKPQIQT